VLFGAKVAHVLDCRSRENVLIQGLWQPIAVAARPKARTVFAGSNTEIIGSNYTGGMDVCVCVLCAFILCLSRVEVGKNTSTVMPARRKRRQKGNPVVSGETVPADVRKG
jgi:hypothetical protein